MDDNEEILEMINARLALGRTRYGHGIRVNDDTRQWGTDNDAWAEMGLEEVLDLALYLAAAMVRLKKADKFCHNCEPKAKKKSIFEKLRSILKS